MFISEKEHRSPLKDEMVALHLNLVVLAGFLAF
jgi:hypothetical protein